MTNRILIINVKEELMAYLQSYLEKEGYIVEYKGLDEIGDLDKYYEGLIYFPIHNINESEETFIINFSKKLNSKSSIVMK